MLEVKLKSYSTQTSELVLYYTDVYTLNKCFIIIILIFDDDVECASLQHY